VLKVFFIPADSYRFPYPNLVENLEFTQTANNGLFDYDLETVIRLSCDCHSAIGVDKE